VEVKLNEFVFGKNVVTLLQEGDETFNAESSSAWQNAWFDVYVFDEFLKLVKLNFDVFDKVLAVFFGFFR
jgi:hypothetical protein